MAKYAEDKARDLAKKATVSVHWVLTALIIISDAINAALDIHIPNAVAIYDQVHIEPPYLTVIEGYDGEMSLKDIANIVNQD